ncbi:hypothetical protein BWI97_03740 [Siphonobacter sp. BAB-5405]|uniref:hypothetical protein n=1 Tax=Siphonobacter sp. BAB-5405 TaxID=1864825 RepID=UPI000C80AC6B|nr:hypothetical protein [Siphonobacter sp. BAB-5405]PMD98651.1 hypothetical protein BWI97_03740 [Siphonobacter sp. BAB-5405]
MSVVLAKLIISLGCILLVGIVLYFRPPITAGLKTKPVAGVLGVSWLLLRVFPFLVIYLWANQEPTSDVNGFWDEGSKASMGQMVYRDFWSPYSPLYAYFLGMWLKIWYNPRMIVLTMALMDGVALVLTYLFYKDRYSKEDLLFKALLYLLLPGSLVLCVVGAQEDIWMWLFVVLAFLVRKRWGVIGYSLVMALGVLTTKAIFGLALFPLFLIEKEKIRFLIPISLIGALSVAILYHLVKLEFLQPLDEANVLRAPNLLSVINPWTFDSIGTGAKAWNWLGLVATISIGCLTAWRMRNQPVNVMLAHLWVAMYGLMMIAQQSAYSNYLFLFLLPLVFEVMDWANLRQVILLFIFNVLSVIHPSYWWRMGMPNYATPADIFGLQARTIDYVIQVGVVVLTGYFVTVAFPGSEKKKYSTPR